MKELNAKDLYNSIPVVYCKHCLSLNIKSFMSNVNHYSEEEGIIDEYDYCDNCGATNLDTCNIDEYKELYKNKYGFYPLEKY
jgi:hypothetical protein